MASVAYGKHIMVKEIEPKILCFELSLFLYSLPQEWINNYCTLNYICKLENFA